MALGRLRASTDSAFAAAARFESAPIAAAELRFEDRRVVILEANDAFAELFGAELDELFGQGLGDHLELGDEWDRLVRRLRLEGGSGSTVLKALDPTSESVLAFLLVSDAEGFLQLVPVSAQQSGDAALRESERRLRDILDAVPAFIYVKDLEGRYILFNRSCQNRVAIVRGMVDADWAPAGSAIYREHDEEVLRLGTAREFHEKVIEGEEQRDYISLKFPLLDEDGRAYAIGGVSTDITPVKRAEEEALQATELAEEANRAKSRFLSRVSHELRTPLNSILGYAQLLESGDPDVEPDQAAATILRAGAHLLNLINDLLDISRIEEGDEQPGLDAIHACRPVSEAVELARPLARQRRTQIAVDLHGGLYVFVLADSRRLNQILLNLISNAISYGREGGLVKIAFEIEEPDTLTFTVTDEGAGIPAGLADRVFAPFDRLDRADGGSEGAGLGLALCKALVEAMGGSIGYRPGPDGGTTFWVRLRTTPAPSDASDQVLGADRPVLAGVLRAGPAKVLYVEDNRANIELVRASLRGLGPKVEVTAALSGRDGIRALEGAEFDLLLLDLHLPDGSGLDLIGEIRGSGTRDHLPIVVLSADATPTQVDQALAAGADRYLTKPLDLRLLLDTVRDLLVDD